MKKFDIISIGSALRDIFVLNKDLTCRPNQICHPFDPSTLGDKINVKKMYFDLGGGGTNTAATFSHLGFKTALFSRVGADLAGKEILSSMRNLKIDVSLTTLAKKKQTGYSVFFIDQSGERTALVFRGASDFNHLPFPPKLKKKLNADWFFITSLNGNLPLLKKIFVQAKKTNAKIAWNPGNAELEKGRAKLQPLLHQTGVAFLNLKEAQILINKKIADIAKIFRELQSISAKTIWCVTDGKAGAWAKNETVFIHAKILDKKVVNATGAGDAFSSGFLSGMLLYHGDLVKSLQLAMLNSNSVVTKMGAKHGLLKKPPARKMLDKIKVKQIK